MTAPHREYLKEGRLARIGLVFAAWCERWFPDPFVIALSGIVVTFILGVCSGIGPARLVVEGGKSFWALVPFTMQMVMIIVGGHVVAVAFVGRIDPAIGETYLARLVVRLRWWRCFPR